MSYYVFGYPPTYRDYLTTRLFSPEQTETAAGSGRWISLDISRKTLHAVVSKKALAYDGIRVVDEATEWATDISLDGLSTISYHLNDTSPDATVPAVESQGEARLIQAGGLDKAAEGISDLPAKYHWGFAHIMAGIDGMRNGLAELGQAARTTSQKAAYEQYEIARDAFRRELYRECLDVLNKAINGDDRFPGYALEWRFHQLQGVIRLGFVDGDLDLMDLPSAENAFLLAARYARTDDPEQAGLSFLCAGWAAYCQGKLNDALDHTQKAMDIHPRLGEAFFQAAKIQMALDRVEEALPLLAKALDLDRIFILKAAGDGDFQKYDAEMRAFLESLCQEKYQSSQSLVKNALTRIDFWTRHSEDVRQYDAVVYLRSFLREGERWRLYDLMCVIQNVEETIEAVLNRMKDHIFILSSRAISAGRDEKNAFGDEVSGPRPFDGTERYLRNPVYEMKTDSRPVSKPSSAKRSLDVVSDELFRGTGERIAQIDCCTVPAGKFRMGKGSHEHQVSISRGFLIGRYPVTQSQWESVMGNNPSRYKGADRPVENVSWEDCQMFIQRINSFSRDKHFRLPTEAEWEYACRAGSTGLFYDTDDEEHLAEYAWYYKNAGNQTHPVGQKKPNAWGICDMLGNVWEWCRDWYGDLPGSDVTDPMGPPSGLTRVARGGSWNNLAKYCQVGNRNHFNPEDQLDRLGFRLVKDL